MYVEQKTLNYSKRILKDKTRTFVLIVLANKNICCPFIFLFDIYDRLKRVLIAHYEELKIILYKNGLKTIAVSYLSIRFEP